MDTPDITGTFVIDPVILQNSNVPSDFPIGSIFSARQYTFENILEDGTFSVAAFDIAGNSTFLNPTETILVGSGDEFTSLFQFQSDSNNGLDSVIFLCGISGIITEAGIEEAQVVVFNLEQLIGEPDRSFIPPLTGRVLNDGDGLMERVNP